MNLGDFDLKKISLLKWMLLSGLILGLFFIHWYAPRLVTEIKNPLVGIIKSTYLITHKPSYPSSQATGKYLRFQSFDNTELVGFITYSKLDTVKGTILLLHGIRASKEHFIKLSMDLANKGYHAVALDSRAHGGSKGTHCTFGVKEKKDIAALITVLLEQEKINDNIGVWGQSLGGAIALQAMGMDKRIKFGIIESTFSDFRIIAHDYFTYHAGFNFRPLTNYLINRAGKIADFDPAEAKPVVYCEAIHQPILIVHGTDDRRINSRYGKENYKAIKSQQKELLEIPKANHLTVWETGGKAYFDKVYHFLDEHAQ